MRRLLVTAFAFASLIGWNNSASGHHSDAWFDRSKEVTLEGKVTRVEWINPHILVFLESKNSKNEPEEWVLEGVASGTARAAGASKEKLVVGSRITARVYLPSRPLMLEKQVVLLGNSPSTTKIAEAGEIRLQNGETMILGRGPGFKGLTGTP